MFNHESTLRGWEFVTRKISDSVAKIKLGQQDISELDNLDAQRDWGFAMDYVLGMQLMLQAEQPDTFVLATSRKQSIRDFVDMSFAAADIQLEWSGSDHQEAAVNTANGRKLVCVNHRYYRPAEVDLLIGAAAKARMQLGYTPTTNLEELCKMMVEADLQRNQQGCSY